jgi:enoyl-CoA hydratase/carnithine racemase
MGYEKIVFEAGEISRITLNDPEKRNAFSRQLVTELMHALKVVEDDRRCRVIILDHEGPVFSAGHDIAEEIPVGCSPRTQETWREFLEWARNEFYLPLWDYSKPILCKIDGIAVAGGIDLSCFADVCYCSDQSFFTWFPIAQMTVATTPSQILFWKIGMWKYKEFSLCRGWTGKEAEANGLVEKSLPREELEDFVMERARLATKAIPESIRFNKHNLRFLMNRLGVRDAMIFGSEQDILAHMHAADKSFEEIMRTEGVKGMVRMAKEKMAED